MIDRNGVIVAGNKTVDEARALKIPVQII